MGIELGLRQNWTAIRARFDFARTAWRDHRALRRPIIVRPATRPPARSATGYDAADTGRLHYSWDSSPTPADTWIKAQLRTLRARSRERVRNDSYAKRFKGMVQTNVVGPNGFALQARSQYNDGRGSDKAANDAIEKAWRKWGDEHSDVSGRIDWLEQQNLVAGTLVEDGEILIRLVPEGEFGMTLQLLDPELLDVLYNVYPLRNDGSYIRMGIEFNKWGKPLAYYIDDSYRGVDSFYASTTNKHYQRIPADQIIHLFLTERVGQSRGVPWMVTPMESMQMLDGYLEAALVNARQGASNAGFFTSEDGEGYTGDKENEDGSLTMEVEPGIMRQLPAGVKFEPYDPTYPESELQHFSQFMLRRIACGLGVSYVGLSGDLRAVNYSSARVGLLDERDVWKALQSWLVRKFHSKVYRRWLISALINEKIKLGSSALSPHQFDKYTEVFWQGRRWAWVDPLKDSKANIANIDKGLMTPSEAIRERGRDPDEVWDEYARDKEKLDSLGLAPVKDQGEAGGNPGEGKKD